MITGELKSKIDAVWNDFWSGGISNPLEVMEQLTYLLFIKGLDETPDPRREQGQPHRRADRGPDLPRRRVHPRRRHRRPPLRKTCAGTASRTCSAQDMYDVVDKYVFPFMQARGRERAPTPST